MRDTIVAVWNWLSTHEWFAIWLEGIALVLIFVWDRIDAKGEHQERMAQIEIARQQAEAATLAARSVMNSERAWLTANVGWANTSARVVYTDVRRAGDTWAGTSAQLALELRNDGRTPAWIETVTAGMSIYGPEKKLESFTMDYIEPLAAGKTCQINLSLQCMGQPNAGESERLRVEVTISYRDIFERKVMTLEYSIDPRTQVIGRFELRNLNVILKT